MLVLFWLITASNNTHKGNREMASNGKSFRSTHSVELPLAHQVPPASGFNLGSNVGNLLNQSTATSLGLIDQQIGVQNALANRAIQYQLYNKTLGDVLGATSIAANPQAIQPTNFGVPNGGGGGGGALYA
jgi:hypothetical protein